LTLTVEREPTIAERIISDGGSTVPSLPAAGPAQPWTESNGRPIPEATVARLATYLRVLSGMREQGTETVSSEELANSAGVNAGLLRKDLSHLGSYGTRGVGYLVAVLEEQLARTLGLSEHRSVVLIGIGNLGQALAGYHGFASRGFRIAGLVDTDPARVGSLVHGVRVSALEALEDLVAREDISIGVIATPAAAAQDIADRLAAAGVSAILNFAPIVLSVPAHIDVRKVDLAGELQILSFHEQRKAQCAVPETQAQ
jgi:redox-sensing transcriptional repressor